MSEMERYLFLAGRTVHYTAKDYMKMVIESIKTQEEESE